MENSAKNISNLPTLVHILKERARLTPNQVAYIFLKDGENEEVPITYGELDQAAKRLAAKIQDRNAHAFNSRVLLIYPQGLEFLIAFFGCLYVGATAVLVFPPSSKKMAKRLNGIVEDCDVSLILSTTGVIEKTMRMESAPDLETGTHDKAGISRMEWINTDELEVGIESRFIEQNITPGHIAFLQYTSGSTGTPKGVMITHNNLMANEKAINSIYHHTDKTIVVGWLPLIHDMGLIGNVLQPLYKGVPLIFMSPLHFMQKPVRWLRAISKYRATSSGAPNFAYDLCVNKISDEDAEGLDLSSWQTAFNGAEPVRKETVERFNRKFAHHKLNPGSHMAVYGLAEATLIVTGTRKGHPLHADEATGYMPSGIAEPCDTIAVVNVETCEEVAEGVEGEIWINGPCVAKGYWNRPDETRETFQAKIENDGLEYMRSGDTGYFKDGQIFITGRIKDVIIIQGKNFHAEDIEWSANDVKGLRAGCIAAFSIEEENLEKLVVVAGTTSTADEELPNIVTQIRAAIYTDHQLHVDRVVLIKPKDLPVTTSGKVQRRLSRQMYLKHKFTVLLDQSLHHGASGGEAAKADSLKFVAASTPAELELVAIWAEILNTPAHRIGINNNFFELGGSSLTMLELSTRLNVSMELLFRYPTISGYLYRSSEYEFPDVANDIYLPPMHINPLLEGPTGIGLITGGTGFFGLHFLKAMMKRTEDTFVLLVRGKTQEAIEKKFDAALAYFHMEADIDRSRVVLIQGDLSKKNVGIPYSKYAWVTDNVDRIFHIGSHVNNWLPYEGIREINVDGTRSLLQLARTGRKKELHYTSTSTFTPKKEDTAVFLEGDAIDPGEINRYFGYDISKYASEEMCKMARNDGIICNVYRLVWVGGHLKTGLTKVNDGLNIMLRILLTLGSFPQGNYLHDIVPVDLMADSMASVIGKAENTNYNITSQSKESIDMKRIVIMLRSMGYRLEEVSRGEFVNRLRNYPMEKWDEHCKSYRQLIIRLFEDPTAKTESFYDSTNFRAHMDKEVLAVMETKFIDTWFEKTINFLVRNNALPTPDGQSYDNDIQKIAEWNQTQVQYPSHACLHQLFEEQAQRTPNAVAIIYQGQATSYRELNRRANLVARNLIGHGVKPRQFVGLSVNRSMDLIASILGIFKAGCAYVPLDPTYPVSSLDFMIDDCGTQHILVDGYSKNQLAHHQNKLLVVDAPEFMFAADPAHDSALIPPVEVSPTDLAYVIYTSGTTGKPKGVLVEHRSVVNHNFSIMYSFGMKPSDVMLQFSTVNFDSFIEEVFPTLFSGAILLMTDKDNLTDIERLKALIVGNSVSVLKFSTAFWHTIHDLDVTKLGVRMVAIGGEAADLNRYNTWRQINPDIPLINTYGPTETTVTATLAVLHGPLTEMTIGKPIANTQVHVLDAQLNQVPLGFVGELYIAGAGVTRGYLNRPDNNAAAFLDSPFIQGEKIYKSGDLVRFRPDGNIDYLGRTDNQVKVRGYRIELGAIESVLGAHTAIESVAVVVKEVDTRKKIIAYFTTNQPDLKASDLRTYLEDILPSYMIPNLMLQLPAIPLNPNGKVDRKMLEDMEISASGNSDFATPSTPSEVKMAKIWEELLNVTGIGLNDDFMELGGHSLLVMSLVSTVNTQFSANLSIHSIYEFPTVGKLLASIEREQGCTVTPNLIRFPELGGKKQATTKAQPLFMVHGLGGHLASFYPLVKNLKKELLEKHNLDITMYGLEANGFIEGQHCFANLSDMVGEYTQRILETQASGPYLIGGWSYGVAIAFHIAQELIRQGHEVGLFISIDAEAPHVPKDFDVFINENNVQNLDDLYQDQTLEVLLGRFGQRFGFFANPNEAAKNQFYRFLGYSSQDPEAQKERFSKVAISNLFNARGFNPKRINPMNTVLVRASSSVFDNYMNDWYALIDSKMLSCLTLNGDHWSIMQDPELAVQLARCLSHSAQAVVL